MIVIGIDDQVFLKKQKNTLPPWCDGGYLYALDFFFYLSTFSSFFKNWKCALIGIQFHVYFFGGR
jgi:hypothetical protein